MTTIEQDAVASVIGRLWARLQYLEKWPNYCRECNGIGIIGHRLSPIDGGGTEWDTCHGCEGTCPRCRYRFCDVTKLQKKWDRLAKEAQKATVDGDPHYHEYWRIYNAYRWNSPSYRAWEHFDEGSIWCPKCNFSNQAFGHRIAPPKPVKHYEIRTALGRVKPIPDIEEMNLI